MCIYYPNRSSLTYTSGDHIFSAAIGGMTKLPKGYVSDEFNRDISKLEREIFREGLPGLARILDGPGKRGKTAPKYRKKGKVSLVSGKEGRPFSLGYIWNNKAYEIPQVRVSIDGKQIAFSYDTNSVPKSPGEVLSVFRDGCRNWPKLRCRTIESDDLEKDIVLLGIAEDIEENFNCFLAKHPENTFQYNGGNLGKIADLLESTMTPKAESYIPTVHGVVTFNPDQLRIFGKIAFNALAHLKGEAFVLAPAFDAVRQWISQGGEFDARWHKEIGDYFRSSPLKIPDKAHYVLFNFTQNRLFASVILYNNMAVSMVMTDQLRERMDLSGFVCDWKNREEFSLLELIASSVETVDKNERYE